MVRTKELLAQIETLKLAVQNGILLKRENMTYKQLTTMTGLGENDVGGLLHGRMGRFSLERLLMIAIRMGLKPKITVS